MTITVPLPQNAYDIIVERGCLQSAGDRLHLNRRVLIVTDDGVPPRYAQTLAGQCARPTVVTLPAGEATKSFARLEELCRVMLSEGFTRTDCVAAVGGGVVGDLAGFAAASFMRGIDFYNLPTTLLSQVDSSVGGKVAVNLDEVKNCVGAFYQPKKVLIDPDVLQTLDPRQVAAGLAEAIKMAATCDEALFRQMEACPGPLTDRTDDIIAGALRIKSRVVTEDEKEQGLRRVLNFGHTFGHAIESLYGLSGLLHGECVALGMLPMCPPPVRQRLIAVLQKAGLPTVLPNCTAEQLLALAGHDKKADGDEITVVYLPEIGRFTFRKIPLGELKDYWEGARAQ